MKLQRILPISAIMVCAAALPSLAGSSFVENSFSLKNSFNGSSSTNVNVSEYYSGTREAGSDATKNEWSVTTTDYTESGTDENGAVRDTTFSEVDRADITTTSFARESGTFSTTTDVAVSESYNFTGFDKDHRVTSGFSF